MRLLTTALFTSLLMCGALQAQKIPTGDFADAIHHWQNKNGKDYTRYSENQSREIAENILLLQRANGGWHENNDPLRILLPEERATVLAEKHLDDTSFDNRNTYSQVEYLARAFTVHQDPRYQTAALAGLRFILDSQLENGGFTHSPPRTDNYRGYITFADEIMPAILTTLRRVAAREEPFQWLEDQGLLARSTDAVKRGDQLILQLQVRQDGKLAAWAGQYHPETLEPVSARSFELSSIVAWESVPVVEYLMRIEEPSPEVTAAIEGAAKWFDTVKLTGFRIEKRPIEPVKFTYHTATSDPVLVADRTAPPIWARFYDLETNQPILATRQGVRVAHYSDISLERRTGYAWYGHWPSKLLEQEYPDWRRKHARSDK